MIGINRVSDARVFNCFKKAGILKKGVESIIQQAGDVTAVENELMEWISIDEDLQNYEREGLC